MTATSSQDITKRLLPEETRTAPSNPGAILLMLGGVLFLAASTVFATGGALVPQLAPFVESAARYGFEASSFFVGGTVLLGLGLVSRFQRVNTRRLLEPGRVANTVDEISAELAKVQTLLTTLHEEQLHVRREVNAVRQEVHQHRTETKASEPKDALFRLAASMDQLGARVDQRVDKATSVLQDGLFDVTSVVENSRDSLHEQIDDTLKDIRDSLERQPTPAMPVQQVYALPATPMYAAPQAAQEYYAAPSPPESVETSDARKGADYPLSVDYEDDPEDEDLHIVVDLEDDDGAEEWSEADGGLGLLDELDDEYDEEDEGAEDAGGGLGLLDELEPDGEVDGPTPHTAGEVETGAPEPVSVPELTTPAYSPPAADPRPELKLGRKLDGSPATPETPATRAYPGAPAPYPGAQQQTSAGMREELDRIQSLLAQEKAAKDPRASGSDPSGPRRAG